MSLATSRTNTPQTRTELEQKNSEESPESAAQCVKWAGEKVEGSVQRQCFESAGRHVPWTGCTGFYGAAGFYGSSPDALGDGAEYLE